MTTRRKSLAIMPSPTEVSNHDVESIPTKLVENTMTEASDQGEDDLSRDVQDVTTYDVDEEKEDIKAKEKSWLSSILAFYFAYTFPIHILIAIGLAKAYPPLGAIYLKPKITAAWIATGIIFFLSGLGLDTGDLLKVVFRHVGFNVFVEVFNFGRNRCGTPSISGRFTHGIVLTNVHQCGYYINNGGTW
jgi:hypothetical protein